MKDSPVAQQGRPILGSIPREFNPKYRDPGYFMRYNLLSSILKHKDYMMHGPLLDFGCGSAPYRSLLHGYPYTGLDFNSPGHDHSRERIDWYYDGKTIPFPSGTFRSIFSTEVFEHVFNLDEVLAELSRVIVAGGHLMITCPFTISEHEAPADFARYTSFGIAHLLESHGFKIVLQEKLGNSLEAIISLIQHYLHAHVSPHITRLPVLGPAIVFTYTCLLNRLAVLLTRVLPAGRELYLSNFIVAQKI